jgi:hypothetical protein
MIKELEQPLRQEHKLASAQLTQKELLQDDGELVSVLRASANSQEAANRSNKGEILQGQDEPYEVEVNERESLLPK